jgi:predicted nucleic acid-binding protein
LTLTALDTSVIVASLLGWHEAHAAAHRALVAAASGRGKRLLVPGPALVEAYAVLTRLPSPHRLAPADAIALLAAAFEDRALVNGLDADGLWPFLHALASGKIAGGRTYDAVILECARSGGARRLLTLDRRDFARLDTAGVEIVEPA